MDTKEDVKPAGGEPSAPVEVVKETPVDTTQQEPQVTEQTEVPQETTEGKEVPLFNREIEWKRKYENLVDKLPSLVEEQVGRFTKKPEEPEYSISQLEAFALERPDLRPWVEEKKQEINRKSILREFDERLKKEKETQTKEMRRTEAFNNTVRDFPDVFMKDSVGRILGLNYKNPVAQELDVIMQDPRIAEQPEAIYLAAELADGRIRRRSVGQSEKKNETLKAEVRNLQKKTLVESGSPEPVESVPLHRQALEKLKQTGTEDSARLAVKAIWEARRKSQEKE